jgi:hypothetical protein
MMTIQNRVLLAYQSILKRIHSWLLPLLIIFLLGSAYGKTNPTVLVYFSWIELNALHFYGGWILCLAWLLLVYDFFFRLLSNRRQIAPSSLSYDDRDRVPSKMMGLINTQFYSLLFLVCLSGLLQYGLKISWWQLFSEYYVEVNLAHQGIAWLFISSAFIKFYLAFTRWLGGLISYLREE